MIVQIKRVFYEIVAQSQPSLRQVYWAIRLRRFRRAGIYSLPAGGGILYAALRKCLKLKQGNGIKQPELKAWR